MFKVGDIVKCKKEYWPEYSMTTGNWVGKVLKVYKKDIKVKTVKNDNPSCYLLSTYEVHSEFFELCTLDSDTRFIVFLNKMKNEKK